MANSCISRAFCFALTADFWGAVPAFVVQTAFANGDYALRFCAFQNCSRLEISAGLKWQ
jgi:hypothetical protein